MKPCRVVDLGGRAPLRQGGVVMALLMLPVINAAAEQLAMALVALAPHVIRGSYPVFWSGRTDYAFDALQIATLINPKLSIREGVDGAQHLQSGSDCVAVVYRGEP